MRAIESSSPSRSRTGTQSLLPTPSQATHVIKRRGPLTYALTVEPSARPISADHPPIICLSGVPGSARDFRYLTPLIAEHAPVIHLTLPGFGALEGVASALNTPMERGTFVQRVADEEGWTRYLLLGHSMGGVTAMYCAAQDPRVETLALLCSVGLRRHKGMKMGSSVARLLLALTYIPGLGSSLAKFTKRGLQRLGFRGHVLDRVQLQLILRHIITLDFKALRATAQRLQMPVFCLWTADDPLIEAEISQELMEAIPHAQGIELESGQHNPQKWCTAQVTAWIEHFYGER